MPSTKTTSHQHSIPSLAKAGATAINSQLPAQQQGGRSQSNSKQPPRKNAKKSVASEVDVSSAAKAKNNETTDKLNDDQASIGASKSDSSGVSLEKGSGLESNESNESKQLSTQDVQTIRKAKQEEAKPSRRDVKIQQHRKKILLAGCEPSMSMNYDTLAMDDYPSNEEVARAKLERDFWYAVMMISSCFFVGGFISIVPAAMSGTAFGVGSLSAAFYFSPLREKWLKTRSFSYLMTLRRSLEFKALSHIQFLEGKDGLAWRCGKMQKYNSNLSRKLFEGLIYYSEQRNLLDIIRHKKQIRLYLLFMMESQKAYKRLQKDYLESHFKHLDQEGWDDNLTEQELADFKENENEYEQEATTPPAAKPSAQT